MKHKGRIRNRLTIHNGAVTFRDTSRVQPGWSSIEDKAVLEKGGTDLRGARVDEG